MKIYSGICSSDHKHRFEEKVQELSELEGQCCEYCYNLVEWKEKESISGKCFLEIEEKCSSCIQEEKCDKSLVHNNCNKLINSNSSIHCEQTVSFKVGSPFNCILRKETGEM